MAPAYRSRDVLLLSGGIDSVAAWVVLGYPPTLHFRFDTPYAAVKKVGIQRSLSTKARHIPRVIRSFADLCGSDADSRESD
jgi:adenylyl- and sulfurtransferase ThiI